MLQVTVTATERKVRNPPSRSTPLVGRSNQRLSDTQCEREGNRVGTWETRSVELSSLGAGGSSLTQTQEGWRKQKGRVTSTGRGARCTGGVACLVRITCLLGERPGL